MNGEFWLGGYGDNIQEAVRNVNRRTLQFAVAAFLGSNRGFCPVQNTITCFVNSDTHSERQEFYAIVRVQSRLLGTTQFGVMLVKDSLAEKSFGKHVSGTWRTIPEHRFEKKGLISPWSPVKAQSLPDIELH